MDNKQTECTFPNDIHLIGIEQELREVFKKLQFTEMQLKQSRLECSQITMDKLELELSLEKERHILAEFRLQLQLKDDAISKWDKEKSDIKENYARHQFQMESLINERKLLQRNVKTLQMENMTLKQNIKETEEHYSGLNMLQETFNTKYSFVISNFDNVTTNLYKLEKEQQILNETAKKATVFGEKMVLILNQHHLALNRANDHISSLVSQLLSQEAELDRLKDVVKHGEIKYIPLFTTEEKLEQQDMLKKLQNHVNLSMEQTDKLSFVLQQTIQEMNDIREIKTNLEQKICFKEAIIRAKK